MTTTTYCPYGIYMARGGALKGLNLFQMRLILLPPYNSKGSIKIHDHPYMIPMWNPYGKGWCPSKASTYFR